MVEIDSSRSPFKIHVQERGICVSIQYKTLSPSPCVPSTALPDISKRFCTKSSSAVLEVSGPFHRAGQSETRHEANKHGNNQLRTDGVRTEGIPEKMWDGALCSCCHCPHSKSGRMLQLQGNAAQPPRLIPRMADVANAHLLLQDNSRETSTEKRKKREEKDGAHHGQKRARLTPAPWKCSLPVPFQSTTGRFCRWEHCRRSSSTALLTGSPCRQQHRFVFALWGALFSTPTCLSCSSQLGAARHRVFWTTRLRISRLRTSTLLTARCESCRD